MLIATMLHALRRSYDGLTLTQTARRNLRARRELADLPPELQRDIGWPPEHYTATAPGPIHNRNRSATS